MTYDERMYARFVREERLPRWAREELRALRRAVVEARGGTK